VVYPFFGQELDLFLEGIDEPDICRGAFDDLAWMWVEGNDHRLAIDAGRLLSQLFQDLLVSGMHAIESADGDDGAAKSRQVVYISIYVHLESRRTNHNQRFPVWMAANL